MTKELIKENIEQTKFKKWQDNTKQMVSEKTAQALIRMEVLKCLILAQQD